MKKFTQSLLWMISLSAVFTAFTGCGTLDRALLNGQSDVTPVVSTNTVYFTNVIPVINKQQEAIQTTNAEGNVVTSYVTVTNASTLALRGKSNVVETNYVTNTTYSLKPQIVTVAKGVETANSLVNPTPSAPIVNLAIEAGLALLAGYTSLRNKKYSDATKAIIQGVETATATVPSLAPIKDAIQASAIDARVSDFVADLVDKHAPSAPLNPTSPAAKAAGATPIGQLS